jgi:hypothetical protein
VGLSWVQCPKWVLARIRFGFEGQKAKIAIPNKQDGNSFSPHVSMDNPRLI